MTPIIHDVWILHENKSDGPIQYGPPGNKGCLAHCYMLMKMLQNEQR